jgi:hypothetical protein
MGKTNCCVVSGKGSRHRGPVPPLSRRQEPLPDGMNVRVEGNNLNCESKNNS